MTQFLGMPPKEGEYLAHLTCFEMGETRRHKAPYVQARVTFLDGPDKGGTMTACWGLFWWGGMMRELGYLPAERYDFEKIQGDWLIKVRNQPLHHFTRTDIYLRAKV